MKLVLSLIIMALTIISAYPIRSLRDHIKSGNLDYVNRYIQDLSEREINQADFQFLNGYILTNGEESDHVYSKIDLTDLSGHLAPVLLYKKGNSHYIKNEFELAIKSFKLLVKKYDKSDYLSPSLSMMMNSYLQLGFLDSANYILDWSKTNLKNELFFETVSSSSAIKTINYKLIEKYTIQLGAFSNKKNANHSINILKKSGYHPRIDKIKINGKILFAVRYGYYQSEQEARDMQIKLKKDLDLASFLKKLD